MGNFGSNIVELFKLWLALKILQPLLSFLICFLILQQECLKTNKSEQIFY